MNIHVSTPEAQPLSRGAGIYDKLSGWEELPVTPLHPQVSQETLVHRQLLEGDFWRTIPGYKDIDEATFLDYRWQSKNSVSRLKHLQAALQDLVPDSLYRSVEEGLHRAPMSLRVTPYLLSLMNWKDPQNCPIRKQFIPMGPALFKDHPKVELDSLHEQEDSPVPGLTHRYNDRVLFLPLDTCPAYCRFCTRSYSIGLDTEQVEKVAFRVNYERWRQAFAYIASRPEIEDVVISGGDTYNLRPEQLEAIGMTLLEMPNIRRIRFATKGLAVLPQKVISHKEWVDALTRVERFGRKQHKNVVIHTHFNHPREATWISQKALNILFERGITVRNQSVLQRGVNDDPETMTTLVRRLGYLNVQPYYVYICDMVQGVEDLRTSVATAVAIEKFVRGSTAGFNTPKFVCDAPGGGGKRSIHSYDYYDRENGIAVYTAPSVKQGKFFLYYDPLHTLSPEAQARWEDPRAQEQMISHAIESARENLRQERLSF